MAHLLIHRGIVNKQYKENLLKSFKQSFKKGYGIETDIHITKDNEFICFHDFTLNRIYKKNVSVKNLNLIFFSHFMLARCSSKYFFKSIYSFFTIFIFKKTFKKAFKRDIKISKMRIYFF